MEQLWSTETTFVSDSILKVTGKGKKRLRAANHLMFAEYVLNTWLKKKYVLADAQYAHY